MQAIVARLSVLSTPFSGRRGGASQGLTGGQKYALMLNCLINHLFMSDVLRDNTEDPYGGDRCLRMLFEPRRGEFLDYGSVVRLCSYLVTRPELSSELVQRVAEGLKSETVLTRACTAYVCNFDQARRFLGMYEDLARRLGLEVWPGLRERVYLWAFSMMVCTNSLLERPMTFETSLPRLGSLTDEEKGFLDQYFTLVIDQIGDVVEVIRGMVSVEINDTETVKRIRDCVLLELAKVAGVELLLEEALDEFFENEAR